MSAERKVPVTIGPQPAQLRIGLAIHGANAVGVGAGTAKLCCSHARGGIMSNFATMGFFCRTTYRELSWVTMWKRGSPRSPP
jgi:hypothetical protein